MPRPQGHHGVTASTGSQPDQGTRSSCIPHVSPPSVLKLHHPLPLPCSQGHLAPLSHSSPLQGSGRAGPECTQRRGRAGGTVSTITSQALGHREELKSETSEGAWGARNRGKQVPWQAQASSCCKPDRSVHSFLKN